MPRRRKRLNHLRKVQILAFMCGFPGAAATLIVLFAGEYSAKVILTLSVFVLGFWIYFALRLQALIVRPLQTASNMLSALREGDLSLKANYVHSTDPLGQLMLEINLLNDVLSEHRLGAIEAHALLDKVLDEVDAAIMTFDPDRRLILANQAARALLGVGSGDLSGHTASQLNLQQALDLPPNATVANLREGHPGRYSVRKGTFRESGLPHELLILIDVSQPLREEELQAWKRLIRVLGHELNNSMAPIRSIAESLTKIVGRENLDQEDRSDLREGLQIIQQRSDGLQRFVTDYARLAKLPPPSPQPISLRSLAHRVASLTADVRIVVLGTSPDVEVLADPDQLEQVLINLVKNAVEAARETNGCVEIFWHTQENGSLTLDILDTGPGIANPENLFIPFFTTKQGGSGIGLTLSRQIVENHKGRLELANRTDTPGCRARIVLPECVVSEADEPAPAASAATQP